MSGSGFTREVRDGIRSGDLVLLTLVPTVLVALILLPMETRLALAFRSSQPTLLTAFAAHYVHLGASHLLANVLTYALLAPLVYLLCLLSGERRLFYAGFATFLLVFPFALSGLEVVRSGRSILVGFSGINAAMFGLLTFALARYLLVRFAGRVDSSASPPAFFVAVAAIATVGVPGSVRSLGLAVAALLSGLLYLESVLGGVSMPSVDGIRSAATQAGYFELVGASLALFVVYPFLAFPDDVVRPGAVINLYAHALGFALSFIATYVTATILRRWSQCGDRYIK